METFVKSFHIYDMIYDENTKKLTYNFEVDGFNHQKVCLNFNTAERISESLKDVLQRYYAVES